MNKRLYLKLDIKNLNIKWYIFNTKILAPFTQWMLIFMSILMLFHFSDLEEIIPNFNYLS